jgi:hypothetical protein
MQNKIEARAEDIIKIAQKKVDDELDKETKNNHLNDTVRIGAVKNLFTRAVTFFNKAKYDIEEQWINVINSNSYYAELGYKELLDESINCLRKCEGLKSDLKMLQDKYNDIMKKIEKIREHNQAEN